MVTSYKTLSVRLHELNRSDNSTKSGILELSCALSNRAEYRSDAKCRRAVSTEPEMLVYCICSSFMRRHEAQGGRDGSINGMARSRVHDVRSLLDLGLTSCCHHYVAVQKANEPERLSSCCGLMRRRLAGWLACRIDGWSNGKQQAVQTDDRQRRRAWRTVLDDMNNEHWPLARSSQ